MRKIQRENKMFNEIFKQPIW